MRYAVFVYSIPLDEEPVGPVEQEGINAELFAAVTPANRLEELIAAEGVQREAVLMDEQGLGMLEAALESWKVADA